MLSDSRTAKLHMNTIFNWNLAKVCQQTVPAIQVAAPAPFQLL